MKEWRKPDSIMQSSARENSFSTKPQGMSSLASSAPKPRGNSSLHQRHQSTSNIPFLDMSSTAQDSHKRPTHGRSFSLNSRMNDNYSTTGLLDTYESKDDMFSTKQEPKSWMSLFKRVEGKSVPFNPNGLSQSLLKSNDDDRKLPALDDEDDEDDEDDDVVEEDLPYHNLQNMHILLNEKDRIMLQVAIKNPKFIDVICGHFKIPKDVITKIPHDQKLYATLRFIYFMCLSSPRILKDNYDVLTPQVYTTVILNRIECCCLLSLAFCNFLKGFNFNYWLKNDENKVKGLLNYFYELNTKIDLERKQFLPVSQEKIRYARVPGDNDIDKKLNGKDRKGVSNIILHEIKNNTLLDTIFTHYKQNKQNEHYKLDFYALIDNEDIGSDALETTRRTSNNMRYVINTECLIAILLCQNKNLQVNEAIVVTNVLDYSSYTIERNQFNIATYKINEHVEISKQNSKNIVIYDEIYNTDCYTTPNIRYHCIKLGAVYRAISFLGLNNQSAQYPVFYTGIGLTKRPCFYHILITILFSLNYNIHVHYYFNKYKLDLGINQDRINRIKRNSTMKELFVFIKNMKNETNLQRLYNRYIV